MSTNQKKCNGQIENLVDCSIACKFSPIRKILWGLKNKGLSWTLKIVLSKTIISHHKKNVEISIPREGLQQELFKKILNLNPGEIVQVRSEKEILTTLDEESKHEGLLWMRGMEKFCGHKFTVLKRINTIRLEGDGRLRKMKNTVLLKDVLCDGSEYYGCDRSCFHFWREAWLKRVSE
jgi:hypothetical protein